MSPSREPTITLFEIQTALPDKRSASPYIWRIRLALNFKQLSYRTHWADPGDIEPLCIEHNIKPTGLKPDGSPLYTFPALIDTTRPSDPVTLSDSPVIALYLERTYPDPERQLFPGPTSLPAPALHMAFARYLEKDVHPLLTAFILGPITRIHTPRGQAFYHDMARTRYNVTIEAIEGSVGAIGSSEREAAWEKARVGFAVLAGFFESNESEGSVWLMGGDQPTYGDLALLGTLSMVRNGSPDEAWKRLEEWDGGRWARFWKAGESLMHVV